MQAMMQSSSLFSTYASLTGSIMLIRTMVDQLIPRPIRAYLFSALTYLFRHILPIKNKKLTLVIEPQVGLVRNEVYEAVELYLGNIIGPNIDKLKVGKISKQKNFSLTIEKDQEVEDRFNLVDLTWKVVSVNMDPQKTGKEKIVYNLIFDKNFKDVVMNEYLPHVMSQAKITDERNKAVRLFTKSLSGRDGHGSHGGWGCVILDHPATFDTMAMNSDLKKSIIQDLDKFLKRREFYRRVGKAWKRGYLLYGPPGTGKSSLIAAIANYLKFDVYDIELTSLHSDSELRRMLLSTSNRSIIVIEDIDCSANLQKRPYIRYPRLSSSEKEEEPKPSQLSLSGMLNFADGLWSSCGEERIIIFTTNHKDKIDPALLRPGRMDMHIHMSYCSYESFRILASRYLGEFDNHKLLEEIEGLIEIVEVTPAEIAEELMRNEDPDLALQGIVNLLNLKKAEAERVEKKNKASMSQKEGNDDFGNDVVKLGEAP